MKPFKNFFEIFVSLSLLIATSPTSANPNQFDHSRAAVTERCSESIRFFLEHASASFADDLKLRAAEITPRAGFDDRAGLSGYLLHLLAGEIDVDYPKTSLNGQIDQTILDHLRNNQVEFRSFENHGRYSAEIPMLENAKLPYNDFLRRIGRASGVDKFQIDLDVLITKTSFETGGGTTVVHLSLADYWSLRANPDFTILVARLETLKRMLNRAPWGAEHDIETVGFGEPLFLSELFAEQAGLLQRMVDVNGANVRSGTEALTAYKKKLAQLDEFFHQQENVLGALTQKTPPVAIIDDRSLLIRTPSDPAIIEGAKIVSLGFADPKKPVFRYRVSVGVFRPDLRDGYREQQAMKFVVQMDHDVTPVEVLNLCAIHFAAMKEAYLDPLLDQETLLRIERDLLNAQKFPADSNLQKDLFETLKNNARAKLQKIGLGVVLD